MVKFSFDQAEFIFFEMWKHQKDYPHHFLRKGHTCLNITDIQFDKIAPILKKKLINSQVKK